MQVLIVGGGKVGSHLAKTLSANGDTVTIVEVSEERCARLAEMLENVTIICGDGDEPYVLDEANARTADALVAATGHDEDNLVVCLLGKAEYQAPLTIARINNAENAWLFTERFGVDVPVSNTAIMAEVLQHVSLGDIVTLLRLKAENMVVDEIVLPAHSEAVGKTTGGADDSRVQPGHGDRLEWRGRRAARRHGAQGRRRAADPRQVRGRDRVAGGVRRTGVGTRTVGCQGTQESVDTRQPDWAGLCRPAAWKPMVVSAGCLSMAGGSALLRMTRIGLLGGAMALAMLLVALPTVASAETAFDSRMRAVRSSAARRVASTDKRVGSGRFTYFTSGSSWVTVAANGWTSGYLPGELWAAYSLTGNSGYAHRAIKRDRYLKASALNSSSNDVGMRFFYSHVRAYQMTGSASARREALAAARKEAARFQPALGALRSRTSTEGSQVIIDELINLELLYWGADNGGSSSWREKARTHARTAARDLVRSDGSVHHIVVYNPSTGAVVGEMKGQGYSVDSMWSRGQAWAIHGFADSYRHTRDPVLLETARKVADRYLADVPADMVPYWDFRAPNIPDEPRDSSAAAIAASGLIDLALLDPLPDNRVRYEQAARATLLSLSSPAYRSTGRNPAILLHGTMNYHSPRTIDVGQSFGDYFFLEALQRLRRLPSSEPAIPIRRVRASSGKANRAVDGSLGTSWTSSGKQWLQLDLGRRRTVSAVSLAVRYGTSRSAGFKIYTSNDRRHWRLVSSARSSAETVGAETYSFQPRRARFVRVVCSGTSRSRANGIAEAAVR